MPLIVEDGSGVEDANSYVDAVYLNSYAGDRGFTLPDDLDVKHELLCLAFDYLEARRGEYQGTKNKISQWPRDDVQIDCVDFDADSIPKELKDAQCQLVIEINNGVPLYPTPLTNATEGFVTEKTVGPLTKKFAATGRGAANPLRPTIMASVEALLLPLLKKGACCSGGGLRTVRVL